MDGRLSSSTPHLFLQIESMGMEKEFLLPYIIGGAEGIRTLDLLNAIEALSQLSYSPEGVHYSKGHRLVQQRPPSVILMP